ncbi:hypothetical protein PCC7424_2075 [Gloeothece citriformis PCC 7424]|uniref:PEP-CTERM protein-sorting domain-containing protein n=1 Tax=Gloeothece citriformis (strain PCC 7424) TaxID=65393 RepID=B7KF46_GLOC7|nr:PEP-CTERM sorting domain-containing protein [Gloeothece citriformis]ACK70502.1 hypothetical protein PCC7424_2075 [Gloeothece citriformis PCC 7424]
MNLKHLLSLSLGTLTVLGASVLSSQEADAAIFTVNGTQYDITTVTGSFNQLQSQLESQVWWGNTTLAMDFASTVGSSLGKPNLLGLNLVSPLFAYNTILQSIPLRPSVRQTLAVGAVEQELLGSTVTLVNTYPSLSSSISYTWAIATEVPEEPVPEPLTILGVSTVVGFGAAFKRKTQSKTQKS